VTEINGIGSLNRAFTVLIFVFVGTLTAYGYTSLALDGSVGKGVHDQFSLYGAYRSLSDAHLNAELHANVAWAAQPNARTWSHFVSEQHAFDIALARLRAHAPAVDRVALATIARDHDAVATGTVFAKRNVGRNEQRAKAVYGGTVLPLYDALNARIEGIAQLHFSLADALNGRWRIFEHRLQVIMVALGLLGMLGLGGLTLTVRAYRKRADEATRRELERLEHAALTDSLTGLGNHRAFREDLLKEISRAKRHGEPLTLALLDVDDFKALNDARGHAHGDAVLAATGRAFGSARREDRAYRIGGDEFAMLLVAADRHRASLVLRRMRQNLNLDGATVSAGYCELEPEFDEHDLYERADAALYAAKRNGRDMMVDFCDIRTQTTILPARKAIALQELLQQRALNVCFQPIWNRRTRELVGFEALARPHAGLGLNGPEEAFDVAERQRRVAELDRLCVDRAFEAAAGLARDQKLFVNITPETLARPDFAPQSIAKAARECGIEPHQLVVELTERRVTDTREMLRHVSELRELGIFIALDDTGTGFAGLEVLGKFTFDFVKIDRSVVVEAMAHRRGLGVLTGIVSIAQQAGSFVIAEGIESPAQLAFISGFGDGIGGVQGYLLGRPERELLAGAAFARYRRLLAEGVAESAESAAS
jgi:diguanylate cyclase (GGDEF)-like protein